MDAMGLDRGPGTPSGSRHGGQRVVSLATEILGGGPKRWVWSLSVLATYSGFGFAWAGLARSTMDGWRGTYPLAAYSITPVAVLAGIFGAGVLAVSLLRVGPPPFSGKPSLTVYPSVDRRAH